HGGQPVAQQAQAGQSAQGRPMAAAPATSQAPMSARPASMQAPAQGAERGVPRVTAAAQPSQVVEELDLDAIERGIAPPPAAVLLAEPARAQAAAAMAVESTEQMVGESGAVDELFTDDWDGAAPAVDGALGGGQEQEQAGWDDAPTEDWREALYRAQSRWDLVKQVCKQKSRSVAALLHSARPSQIEPASEPDERPVLVLQADFKFHYEKLREPTSRLAVEWAIAQVIEMPIRVRLVFNSAEGGGNAGGNGSGGSSGPGGFPSANSPAGLSESFAPRADRADSSPSNGHNGQRSIGRADAGLRAVASTGAPAIAPSATDNVRQFTTERGATNGNRRATAAAGEMREAAPGYDALLSNITPLRPSTRTAPRPASPDARTQHRLEDDVRADAVIQALMRTHGVELADVRPLNDDE
ncbi:MAG: hypothetical protein ACXVCO_14890, partial [Ktedonobacterales bacterium]